MMCPKCGKLIDNAVVRCPDCGAEFDPQYAAPRVEPGPTGLQQTQPTVLQETVPVGRDRKRTALWWVATIALCAIMLGAILFAVTVQ